MMALGPNGHKSKNKSYIQLINNYTFVPALLNAVSEMFGILLTVFTLIEISKPEVKVLFTKVNLIKKTINSKRF